MMGGGGGVGGGGEAVRCGEGVMYLASTGPPTKIGFLPVSLFHLLDYLFCLFSPFLWETTQNDTQELAYH